MAKMKSYSEPPAHALFYVHYPEEVPNFWSENEGYEIVSKW